MEKSSFSQRAYKRPSVPRRICIEENKCFIMTEKASAGAAQSAKNNNGHRSTNNSHEFQQRLGAVRPSASAETDSQRRILPLPGSQRKVLNYMITHPRGIP